MTPVGAHAHIDWQRLGRRSILAAMGVFAVAQLFLVAKGTQYGFDFRGGTWQAGNALLHGRSPYPAGNAPNLLHVANGFIDPPPLALLGAPLSLLPFTAAAILWNVGCAAALIGALRLVGVRELRIYLLALCSFPFISSVALGQPDGLFALLLALTWRYRDSPRGALAAGALIAAKLLAWPLVLWFVLTRRARLAGIAVASATAWLAASWACIGFKGLLSYPGLLAADTAAYGPRSHSFATAVMRLGVPARPSELLGALLAVGVGWAIVACARRREEGYFMAALVIGLLCSPVLWQHYLVLVLVAIAVLRRIRDPAIWLPVAALWLSPAETPSTIWQAWLVPLVVSFIALRAVTTTRCETDAQRFAGAPLPAA